MARRRRVVIVGIVAALGALAAGMGRRSGRSPRRVVREAGDRIARRSRDLTGRWSGVSYRLKGRRPDPDVADLVLADRVRSTLGPLERRLDVPRVHVMVEDHVVLLHGELPSPADAEAIESAVARVSGVLGVESYLHIGLAPSDTRPSQGREARHPSEARARLLAVVRATGVGEEHAPAALRSVLASFAERLPAEELGHLRAHLPDDVRVLFERPRRVGAPFRRVESVPELVAAVIAADGPDADVAPQVIGAVLAELKRLVPEEVADVAAVLPLELRTWWEEARPA